MARRKRTEGRWEKWAGGRCWVDLAGRRTYYVRRRIAGVRFEVKTPATTERAAFAQLERFLKNPEGYDPRGDPKAEPIVLTNELSADFLRWSMREAGNTAKWVASQKVYLAWWMEKLPGLDLRRARLTDHVLPALKGATCRPHKIAVLKRLYSWLRKVEHKLSAAEDPTLEALSVPQSRPEQARRVKALPAAHVASAIEHLSSDRWRDLLRVLAGSGMHVAELARFSTSGAVEALRPGRPDGAATALVLPSTKAGDPLRVPVSPEVAEAARRVLEAGSFDVQKLDKALRAACREAGIEPFGPGRLRHTVATEAINRGADPATVAAFLNHKSPRTTRRFYATHATPAKIPTLL